MAATGSDTVLELDRLSVAYDRAPVVRDLTLTVGRGEVVALLGANGAGKTTTLRAISGLLKPVSGAVRLAGLDLAGVSATARARLGLAHVPHDRGIFFGLTVAEHFRLDRTNSPAQMDATFDHFPALRRLRGRKAGLLSGGEQQMLAIARALMSCPRLFLLDEPSLGLAPLIVQRIGELLTEIQKSEGLAVILAEQNALWAMGLAQRTAVIDLGRIQLAGPSETLRNNEDVRRAYLGT